MDDFHPSVDHAVVVPVHSCGYYVCQGRLELLGRISCYHSELAEAVYLGNFHARRVS